MKAKFCFLFILSITFTTVHGQWNPAGGPEGGYVKFVEQAGNELWAGSNAGVYHSLNNGATWSKLSLPNDYCHDIEFFNDTIIVLFQAISTDSLPAYTFYSIHSFDDGISWSAPSVIETNSIFISDRSIIYRYHHKLLIKGQWDFYTSDDFGDTWTLMTVPVFSYMYWVYGKDGKFLARFTDSGTTDALYYNDDGLQNWVFVDSTYHIQDAMIIDTVIIAVTHSTDSVPHQMLIRSADKGISWDTVFQALPGAGLGGFVEFNGTIYAATYPDYLQSTDAGITWTTKVFPAGFYPVGAVLLSNGEMLNASYTNGIIRYDPSQGTLNPSSTGISASYTNCLFAHHGNLYMSSTDFIFKSSDGGITWDKLPPGFSNHVSYFFRGDTLCFANEEYTGGITFSFDNGITWDTLQAPVGKNWSEPTSIEEHNGRLFLSGSVVSYSDDWGHSWNTLTPFPQSANTNGYLKEIDSILYAVTNDGYIFRYNDTNANWIYLTDFWSPGAGNGNKLYKLDNKLVMDGRDEILYSSDQGLSWTYSLLYGAPDSSFSGTNSPKNLINSGSVWLGTCGKYGVYFSQDNGDNWNKLPGNSPFFARGGLTILNSILYSGSYCSSVWRRSGPLNIISGNVFYDANTNGVKDPGEKNLHEIIIATAPTCYYSTTDQAGNYSVYTDAVGDSLFVVSPGTFVTVNPDHYTTNGPAINQDFALSIQPGNGDLSINMTNVNVFNPGFLTSISIQVSNLGSVEQAGIAAVLLDTGLNFISATPPQDFQIGDTLFWNIDTLAFFDKRDITLMVYTDPNKVTFGDTISCYSFISAGNSDLNNNNNTSTLLSQAVGSYDPNDKSCNHGGYFTPVQLANNEAFEYTIRFQNTGNFAAANVHIRDTLHFYTDPSTIRILSSSHTMHWALTGNGIIDFYFDNINLPDSGSNQLLSHGFVKYAVNLKPAAQVGNAITNTAYIYFDFNAPVMTNTTTTMIAYPVISTGEETITEVEHGAIKVYPNPTPGEMWLDTRGINEEQKEFYIFDLHGKRIGHQSVNGQLCTVNTHDLKQGMYIGILVNKDNLSIGTFRFIKQ